MVSLSNAPNIPLEISHMISSWILQNKKKTLRNPLEILSCKDFVIYFYNYSYKNSYEDFYTNFTGIAHEYPLGISAKNIEEII